MVKFIGIHRMDGPVTEDKLANSWATYKEIATKRGLKPIRVTFSAEEGIAICETEANSKEEVKEAHQKMNMVPAEIIEVKTSE